MPSSDLLGLAILPAVMWASLTFVVRSTSRFALKLRASLNASSKQELFEGARSWALYGMISFLLVLIGVVAWSKFQRSPQINSLLTPSHWERGVFVGIILGVWIKWIPSLS